MEQFGRNMFLVYLKDANQYCPKYDDKLDDQKCLILDNYIREKTVDEKSNFQYVVQCLTDKTLEVDLLPVSVVFDWFINPQYASDMIDKHISAAQFAQRIIDCKYTIAPAIESLLGITFDRSTNQYRCACITHKRNHNNSK